MSNSWVNSLIKNYGSKSKRLVSSLFLLFILLQSLQVYPQDNMSAHDFYFKALPVRWDEALPQGNGWLGALIWQKNDVLHLSLDRIDLWDERPMPEIDKLRFDWVYQQVLSNAYDTVQKLGDRPYEIYPAPSKLPGAALEFFLPSVKAGPSALRLKDGVATVEYGSGVTFRHYVHADQTYGFFQIVGMHTPVLPKIIMPEYQTNNKSTAGNSVEGQSLSRLGYQQGQVIELKQGRIYHQEVAEGHYYEVRVDWTWDQPRQVLEGSWTITWDQPALPSPATFDQAFTSHQVWWTEYWSKSELKLDDQEIERQYYREMYKFGCVVRSNTSPIALQAIWTADEGKLPPWKGDLHHDLNTQLSYWPGYTANHLDLTQSYSDWLWGVQNANRAWTERMFGLPGLNVPGVTTRQGKEMGGWIQYSMSPTTACWLAQHMYWQYAYGRDTNYLKTKVLPYLQEVARFASAYVDNYWSGRPFLSSSPEYHNNSIHAWFRTWTNYDLSLVKYIFRLILMISRDYPDYVDQDLVNKIKSQTLPDYSVDSTGLLVAEGQPLTESHRHHAHLMPIQPLDLITISDEGEQAIIKNSLRHLERMGTRQWTGYSFCWAACLYSRAEEGDRALDQLQKFARNFTSTNSFHLNGDQRGGEFSDFTYRPFTLEGNFAFAQAVHDLLVQSHHGIIRIVPAWPSSWHNVSFRNLRTEGAFLVSAKIHAGALESVEIRAEKGGELKLQLPHLRFQTQTSFSLDPQKKVATFNTSAGEIIRLNF